MFFPRWIVRLIFDKRDMNPTSEINFDRKASSHTIGKFHELRGFNPGPGIRLFFNYHKTKEKAFLNTRQIALLAFRRFSWLRWSIMARRNVTYLRNKTWAV